MKTRQKLSPEQIEAQNKRIAELFEQGLNCAEIGRKVGLTRGATYHRASDQGLDTGAVIWRDGRMLRVNSTNKRDLAYPSSAVIDLPGGSAYKEGLCNNQDPLSGVKCTNERLLNRAYCAACGGSNVFENGLKSSFPECKPVEF